MKASSLAESKLLMVLLFAIPITAANAQHFRRTAITNFNIDNGLLQNTVISIAVDKYGFVWFSSAAGIQRYDGSRFETMYPSGKGMTEDKSARLNIIDNKEIWISHINGITTYDPDTHRSKTIYKNGPVNPAYLYQYAGEDMNSVWYLAYNKALLEFSKKNKQLVSRISLPPLTDKGHPVSCHVLKGKFLAVGNRHVFAVFDIKNKRFSYVNNSPLFIHGLVSINDSTVLLLKDRDYYKFNIHTKKETQVAKTEDLDASALEIHLKLMSNGNILAGYNKNLCELDSSTFKIKTKWAGFNQQYLVNSGYITNTYLDRYNQLWVMSNSDGVKKINLSQQPFQYYGTAKRENNFVRGIYVNKSNGLILAGTYGSGLLMFDTSGHLLHHLPKLAGTVESIVSIAHLAGNKYLLLALGNNAFYVFDSKSRQTFPLYVNTNGQRKRAAVHASYYAALHKADEETFLFVDHEVFKFKIRNGEMTDTITVKPHSLPAYNYVFTKRGEHCFSTSYGMDFFDRNFKTVRSVETIPGIKARCIGEDGEGNLWLGTETGLYKVDSKGTVLKKYTKEEGLPDDGIYAIQGDKNGVYFSHNKGLSYISTSDKLTHYSRHSGLQENEFNTKSTFRTDDGTLYFGGINGITSFYPAYLSAAVDKPNVYVTALHVMNKPWKDTAVWNISAVSLPHTQNSIGIRIGAPGAAGNTHYNYEYRMEGLDPNWVTTSGVDFIRYVLPPGAYTFKARIGNMNDAVPNETKIEITIAAPWWQQWGFRIIAVFAVIAVVVYVIYNYNRRKYLMKIKQLEVEHRIQLERERISRDLHDNIGAYASAIVNTVDKVVKNPGDITWLPGLKDNASEIMINLRDTIWAFNKNNISATRLSDRIKTYIQKMRETYHHIKIEMEEEVDADVLLSPEFALNLLRIVQEATHNAVRHSNGNRITVVLKVNEQLYISIQDNGSGFAEGDEISGGNGFANMKTRAKENNVALKVSSSEREGTTIELFSTLQ